MSIIYMSIVGSILYLIFSIFKPLTKKHFSSSWHYFMLISIMISFIIPYRNIIKIQGLRFLNISNTEIVKSLEPIEKTNINKNILGNKENTNYKEDEIKVDNKYNKKNIADYNYNEIKKEDDILSRNIFTNGIIRYIWLTGMLIILSVNIISYLKFKRRDKYSSKLVNDKNITYIFNNLKENLKINKNINLKINKNIESPMLIGIINPSVIIPNVDLEIDKLKDIFLHEFLHYKRNDILIKFIMLLIKSIHWFNPIIYLIIKDLNKFCEYSIDEQVVMDKNISERKKYADTILSLIDNSINKNAGLTTSMTGEGLELKSRLENMIYFTKIGNKKKYISAFTAVIILFSGLFIGCSIINEEDNMNESLAVYIKSDGLYYSYINNKSENKIADGSKFEYPLISKKGNYIAYIQENSLYIYNLKNNKNIKVDENIVSYYNPYDWISDKMLVYGSQDKTGIIIYDLQKNEKTYHDDEYYYTGLKYTNSNRLYARRDFFEGINEEYKSGIVEFNLKKYDKNDREFENKLIVEDLDTVVDKIGTRPIVWDASIDGEYVYIMEKFASGSFSSDVIGIGIYSIKDKSYKTIEKLETLPYKNNLAISKNKDIFGIVEGSGRDMFYNKNIALTKINKDKSFSIIKINDDLLACQTPVFNHEGDKILYSATKESDLDKIEDYNDEYIKWKENPHNIYEYDLITKENKMITDGYNYDLLPIDLTNDEILFLRYQENDKYSLVKTTGSEETILVGEIIFVGGEDNSPFEFYGHIDTEKGMDIFVNNNKTNAKMKTNKSYADNLFKYKDTFLGDNSKVRSIINNLEFPEEIEIENIELFTKSEPLGLQINLKSNNQVFSEYISSSSEYLFRKNSVLIFSLISNLDYIQYNMSTEDASYIFGFMNREVADDISKNVSKNGLELATKNKQSFINLYNGLNKILPNKLMTGNIVINKDKSTVLIKELEIVELDNSKRVEELKLDENEFPNGYTIIDKNKDTLEFKITENTIYNFTDIKGYFIENLDSNRLYSTINLSEFLLYLNEYNLNDIPLENQTIPYFIEIKDGEVISITERFKYTI